MTLEFFVNSSDPRVVTKSLTSLGIIDGVIMRDNTDVLSPVFVVETAALPTTYNYCRCDYLGRYYYTRPVLLETGLTEIHCRCDVLSSFDAYIRAQTATITRNEKFANGYLIDNRYNAYAYEEIVTKTFPSGLSNDSLILMTVG